jgi:hypothetical protein
MTFALLTLLAALLVASVSEWFSIVGIMSIYAGAPYNAALVMGAVLGIAKLVSTSWLYRNWKFASWKLKIPLIYFTVTFSIGVFGFLTKSHLEQGAATIDNSAKVERLDQQIAREKSLIVDNEKVIAQLDTAINSYLGKDRADRALSVRKVQAPQRKQLRDDILSSQKLIDQYSEQRLTLTSQVRAMQLEVGPIRYIAELFYGNDTSDTTKIESAVRIFTLLIVSTLDPLAVILLIAANHTLLRIKDSGKKDTEVKSQEDIPVWPRDDKNSPTPSPEIDKGNIASSDSPPPSIQENQIHTIREDKDDATMALYSETPTVDEKISEETISTEIGDPEINEEEAMIDEFFKRGREIARKLDEVDTKFASIKEDTHNDPLPMIIPERKPWAHQESVLSEILGNMQHFIPQRLNETKESSNVALPINGNSDARTSEEIRPENAAETQKNIQTGASPAKYPVALSWLKEFKGT